MPLSEDEELEMLRLQKAKAMSVAPQEAPKRQPPGRAERIKQGMLDMALGGAQFLGHVLPVKPQQGQMSVEDMDKMMHERESQYQERREGEGTDWYRLLGNVVSPANLAMARGASALADLPQMVTLSGKIIAGTAQGLLGSAMSPVSEGQDYWQAKKRQLEAGAATGALIPMAAAGISRAVAPKTAEGAKDLLQAGVSLTPGQMAGGWARSFEEKLKSVPLVGDIISAAEKRATKDFNRVAINQSLSNIGQKLPDNVPIGHEAIEHADQLISDAYDALVPNLQGKLDRPFMADLVKINRMGKTGLPDTEAKDLTGVIDREIIKRFTPQGGITGESLKQIDSRLGTLMRDLRRSPKTYERDEGAAIGEIKKSLLSMLERNNPGAKDALGKIDRAYAEFQRVQVAAARQGAKDGLFSPAQFLSAVRQLDPSMRKKAYSKGDALLQDLAEKAKNVLSPNVPDSGTPGRAMAAAMLARPDLAALGTAASIPTALLYSRPGQYMANMAMAMRPGFANQAAQAIGNAAPYASLPLIPLSAQIAQQP